MKIMYNNDYIDNFKQFNEIYSIATNYHKIKKTGYIGNTNFIVKNIICLIIYGAFLFLYLDLIISKNEYGWAVILLTVLFAIFTLLVILDLIGFFTHYYLLRKNLKSKKKNEKNTLIVGEDGIEDDTNDICVSSKWSDLCCVVLGKYSICILTNATIYYIFPISIKDKLLKAIDKFNTNMDLKIITK